MLRDSEIYESVIGLRSIIGPDVCIKRTVVMGADVYETPERKAENRRLGQPNIGIARGCTIESAIIDKNARIGEGVTIRAHPPEDEMVETESYVIRDGIVVVLKDAIIPDGTVI
jgi:glucose-1-phosphate adenylyltransferase